MFSEWLGIKVKKIFYIKDENPAILGEMQNSTTNGKEAGVVRLKRRGIRIREKRSPKKN